MKGKRRSIANVIGLFLMLVFTFACSSLSYGFDDSLVEEANPSNGVTLLKNTNNEIYGINLNGNSVIIKDGSTSGKVNFFVDSNKNGVVDSGESALLVPDITGETTNSSKDVDISEKITVYAVHMAVLDSDLRITVDTKESIYNFTTAYKSHIKGSVTVDVKKGSLYTFKGLDSSTCDDDLSLNSNGGSFLYFYGAYGYSDDKSYVGGNAEINITKFKKLSGYGSVYGYYYSDIQGDASLIFDDVLPEDTMYSCLYGCYTANVKGNLDVDVKVGALSSIYGAYGTIINGDVSIDIGANENIEGSGAVSGTVYGINASGYEKNTVGKVDVNIHDLYANGSSYNYYYGISAYGTTANVSSSDSVTLTMENLKGVYCLVGTQYVSAAKDIKVTLEGIDSNYDIKGSNNDSCGGDIIVNMKDVTGKSTVYGAYAPSNGGNIKSTLTNVESGYVYSVYGTGTTGGCGKDIIVIMTNCKTLEASSGSMYLANYVSCGGSATLTSKNNKSRYLYLGYSLNTAEGITVKSDGDETYEDPNAYFYSLNNSSTGGAADVEIKNAKVSGLYACGVYAKDGADVLVKDSKVSGQYFSPAYTYRGEETDELYNINVRFSGVEVLPYYNSEGEEDTNRIACNTGTGMITEVVFDDDCVLPEKSYISAGKVYGKGYSSIKYKNNLYVAGNYDFTSTKLSGIDNLYVKGGVFTVKDNVKVKNLTVIPKEYDTDDRSIIVIPKGKTMEVTGTNTYSDMEVVLEGTFKAASQALEEGATSKVIWYINGGSSTVIRNADTKYYPVDLTVTGNTTSISTKGTVELDCIKDILWSKVNSAINVVVTTVRGYHFASGTVKGESETTAIDMPYSDVSYTRTYSFDMLNEKTIVNIVVEANPINIGKSVSDPVAIVNKSYTEESPLYDFNSLVFTGDIEEGDIKCELASGSTLPSGLTLKDNKIIGKATSANDGVKVKFAVTARNGSKGEVTLNIIVANSEKINTYYEGRISVDTERRVVNLFGNSVVFKADGDETAIYADDNKDKVADSDVPMFKGDLVDYTVYGLKDTSADFPVSITVDGGMLGDVYGAVGSVNNFVSEDEDAISINIVSGRVGNVCLIDNSTFAGDVYVSAAKGTYTNIKDVDGVNTTRADLKGSYIDIDGDVKASGSYVIKQGGKIKSLSVIDSKKIGRTYVKLKKDINLEVEGNISIESYSGIYLDGTLKCDSKYKSLYGLIAVTDTGKFETEDLWSRIYYRSEFKTNLVNTNIRTQYYDITIPGEDEYIYLNAGATINLTFTDVREGYDLYYKINDGNEKALDENTITYTVPFDNVKIEGIYKPRQISVENYFAAPSVNVNEEYTEANPVFNYNNLLIEDDTNDTYKVCEKTIEYRSGKLPEGLKFENGIITGKATQKGSYEFTVKITGLNGTTVNYTLEYVVKDKDDSEDEIDSLLTLKSTVLYLNGNSVVITNSSEGSGINVFLDKNHDGIADNNRAFTYNGSATLPNNLMIIGYGDAEEYDGDITIHVYGGTISTIHGANNNAKVNGKVGVYIKDGEITSYCDAVNQAYAEVAELKITGGSFTGVVAAAYTPLGVKEVNLEFGGKAVYTGSTSYSYFNVGYYSVSATKNGTVDGDVNIKIGASKDNTNIPMFKNYGGFTGVNKTKVSGNVNAKFTGDAYVNRSSSASGVFFVVSNESEVTGDVNVNWVKGNVGSTYYYYYGALVENSTVRDINLTAAKTVKLNKSVYLDPLYNATARNVNYDVSVTNGNYISSVLKDRGSDTYTLTGTGVLDRGLYLSLYGKQTLQKDINVRQLLICDENTEITIDSGVEVLIDKAVNVGLQNYGKIINNGEITVTTGTSIDYSIYNYEGGYGIVNNGSIRVNNNIQNYDGTTIENKGVIETTRKLAFTNAKLINSGKLTVGGDFSVTNSSEIDNKETGIINVNKTLSLGTSNVYNDGTINFTVNSGNGLSVGQGSTVVNKEKGSLNVASIIYNKGEIYSYGEFVQTLNSYRARELGTIYFAKDPELSVSNLNDLTSDSYAKLYFPVTVTYPAKAIESASFNGVTTNIEGDNNKYCKFGSTLTVTVDKMNGSYTYADIQSLSFAKTDELLTASSVDNQWTGKMPFGRTEVVVNMKSTDGGQITVSPTKISIPELTVGVDGGTIYDLTTISISNDAADGEVYYSESSAKPLPKGLKVSGGKIVGTPAVAYEDGLEAQVVITGKNFSRAVVDVTFAKINKGTPAFKIPECYGYAGDTLSQVWTNYSNLGTYSWDNSEVNTVIDDKVLSGEKFTLYFTPFDVDNYDWTNIEGTTWDETNKRLVMEVSVNLYAISSADLFEDPSPLGAVYGDKLSSVTFPEVENGHFEWDYYYYPEGEDVLVGDATVTKENPEEGRLFRAKFIPDDSVRYKTCIVWVNVAVEKLTKEAVVFDTFAAKAGGTIGDIDLPENEDGTYEVLTNKDATIEYGKDYKFLFVPTDKENINWTVSEEAADNGAYYSETYDGVVFYATLSHEHVWDEGVVIKEPTVDEEGEMLYTCTICGETKIEPIAKLENGENGENENQGSENQNGTNPGNTKPGNTKPSKPADSVKYGPAKGTKISDGKLIYKVTKVGSKGGKIVGEVEVVGIKNKKSKSVKIAASVTIDGVKYNVTSIGKKAFKGCKKLKKVTIGSNVKTILANAFAKCKKLKKVTIKSKKLKKVAKGSFKGVKKSCKIKVPKAKKKAYKKMFKKAKCKAKIK